VFKRIASTLRRFSIKRPVRVCGIGEMFTLPAHGTGGHARELVDQPLDEAARTGAAMPLLFSERIHRHQPTGVDVVSMTEAELSVTESSRRGALGSVDDDLVYPVWRSGEAPALRLVSFAVSR
jgi:hypothetical protein